MRVAGSTRHALRGVFLKHQLPWDWSDSELDKWVRAVRKSLSGRLEGAEQESKALSSGLLPAVSQLVQLEEVEAWDDEQWCELCWDVLEAATAQTQSFLRFPSLRENGDAWRELTEALREGTQTKAVPRTFILWGCFGGGACVLLSTLFVSMSGRMLLWSVLGAVCLAVAGEAWRRWGADVEWSAGTPFLGQERELQGFEATAPALDTGSSVRPQLSIVPAVGSVVKFKECTDKPQLSHCFGVVERREGGVLAIALAGGALVEGVSPSDITLSALTDVEPPSVRELLHSQLQRGGENTAVSREVTGSVTKAAEVAEAASYVPLQGQTRLLDQAKKVKESLVLWHGRSAMLPVWAKSFWHEVGLLEPLEQRLKALLLAQGYLGRGVGSPPRFKELKEKLDEMSTAGAVAHSLDAFRAQESVAWMEEGDEGPESWEAALPPDLKRAGPEIYSSMKASGVRCVRDWVNSMFSVDQRQSAHYVDLFNLASLVDFKAKEGGASQSKVLSIIAQDDTCEVALRRLAAWIHERRTGDRDAAQSMLAIKPSSFATDVAPSWLVTEAATYSQSEHKRRERARVQGNAGASQGGGAGGGGKAGGKGKSKGKDKKKGAATQG